MDQSLKLSYQSEYESKITSTNEASQRIASHNDASNSVTSHNVASKSGVVLIRKTSKIHFGSFINKLNHSLSVSGVNQNRDLPNFSRQSSAVSSDSTQSSCKPSESSKDQLNAKIEKEKQKEKEENVIDKPLKKRHAPVPPPPPVVPQSNKKGC